MSQTRTFGDICEFDKQQGMHKGLPYLGLEHIESGTGRFFLSGTNPDAKSSTFRFSDKHILYGRLRPYLKKVALPDSDGRCSTEIFPILPKSGVDRRYLSYWLMSDATTAAISATCTGARMPRANMNEVLDFKLFVPNEREQQRIVAILDEAFAGIATARANAEKNLQNARDLLASEALALLKPDTSWRRLQLSELLECGWIVSHLDGNHGADYPRKEEFVGAGVPYIAASAIKGDIVDFREAKYLSSSRAASMRKGLAKSGDVLFAHNATVGPVAILRTAEPFVILGTSLTYYRCDPRYILPEFLAKFMVSPAFTSQYEQVMKQSTRNQVPITKQREFYHLIPPLKLQCSIAARLDEISDGVKELKSLYTRKLAALEALKQSLLHRAFSGQL